MTKKRISSELWIEPDPSHARLWVLTDEDGPFAGYAGVVIDVAEMAELRKALRDIEYEYEQRNKPKPSTTH